MGVVFRFGGTIYAVWQIDEGRIRFLDFPAAIKRNNAYFRFVGEFFRYGYFDFDAVSALLFHFNVLMGVIRMLTASQGMVVGNIG